MLLSRPIQEPPFPNYKVLPAVTQASGEVVICHYCSLDGGGGVSGRGEWRGGVSE